MPNLRVLDLHPQRAATPQRTLESADTFSHLLHSLSPTGAVPVPAPTHATSAGADPGGSAAAEGASLTESYVRITSPSPLPPLPPSVLFLPPKLPSLKSYLNHLPRTRIGPRDGQTDGFSFVLQQWDDIASLHGCSCRSTLIPFSSAAIECASTNASTGGRNGWQQRYGIFIFPCFFLYP